MVDEDSSNFEFPEVCVYTHPLNSAGENATRSLLNILSVLTTVSLVTADLPADTTIRENFSICEINKSGVGDSIFTSAIRFVLNQLRMCREVILRDDQVVLFFGATSYLLPMIAAKLSGRTVVVEPRGDVPLTLRITWETSMPSHLARCLAWKISFLERVGFHIADEIITYSPAMAQELGLEAFEEKLHSNGARYVDLEKFVPMKAFDSRGEVVGYVGRFDEEKGVRTLAKVARQLPKGVTFRFIGDGPLRSWLRWYLSDEIEAGSVELVGWVEHNDVPHELNDLKLLVMLSEPTEGLPTIILEALACGTPVCAPPVSGVPDVVKDGETGFLIKDREASTIAKQITSFLYREDLDSIGQNGRLMCESEFSFEAAVDRYRDILHSL